MRRKIIGLIVIVLSAVLMQIGFTLLFISQLI